MLPRNQLSRSSVSRVLWGDMNARRILSILVLGALLLAQAPQALAGRMLCRMKMPARTEECSRCDAPKASETNGSLRAADCCRIAPAHATEATPLVPVSRTSSAHDPLPPAALEPASLGVAIDADGVGTWIPASGPPGSERLSRTLVLRN
jgi:hypothetical protein